MDQSIIDKHRDLLEKTSVVIARNKLGDLIVVRSRRSHSPSVPFIITADVFQQWKEIESSIAISDLPYEELNTAIPLYLTGRDNDELVIVDEFDKIEFNQ